MTLDTFQCSRCNAVHISPDSGGTGYAVSRETGAKTCYACMADVDSADMLQHGNATLYLTGREVTNWPGTLRFLVTHVRKGRHNIARTRYDAWFTGPDGKPWHGTQYGENTQIIRCRRVKA